MTATTTLSRRLASGIQGLFPGYFAVVMATGIISIASKLLGLEWILRKSAKLL